MAPEQFDPQRGDLAPPTDLTGATEACDAADVDEDCDGLADDHDTAATGSWYRDADADTFGAAATSTTACDLPSGYVATATDCDDGDATVSPAALEVCDAADIDEDCDGLAGAGDVDGDGVDDLWIGAPSNTGLQGAAYLLLGPISGTVALASADAKILGTPTYGGLGWNIRAPGDVDGDGYRDAFIGAPWVSTVGYYNGAIYLVTDPLSGDIASVAAATMIGVAEGDTLGEDYFDVGDVNGDGDLDLLAGAPLCDEGATDGGSVWLVYGPMVGTSSIADADAQWVSSEASALLGLYNVAIVPDTNGDGADEIAVGARAANTGAYTDNGAVWMWLGEP